MKSAALITKARCRAGLSKRELARRAGTSPAAIVTYEQGTRDPSVETLNRILAAAGSDAVVRLALRSRPDPRTAGEHLVEVLDLADALPHRRSAQTLPYPRFGRVPAGA